MAESAGKDSPNKRFKSSPETVDCFHPNATRPLNPSLANTNPLVSIMLTDLYQITMGYAYWKAGKQQDNAIFDVFFRKNPFHGEFTLFGGLEEVIRLLANFKFTSEDIDYIRQILPDLAPEFYTYLANLDSSAVKLYSLDEGAVCFPKVPLIRLEGPLLLLQLLETPILTLVNYASLVATNAARLRIAVGPEIGLLEFGLRRAQGPDGGLSASRYCYVGGFDGTSNVLAGQIFGIPVKGTHAHAFVTAYNASKDTNPIMLTSADGTKTLDLLAEGKKVMKHLTVKGPEWGFPQDANPSELVAFASYAHSFPTNFLALVDTYEVMKSGMSSFSAIAIVLNELGYKAAGLRLDSGDLAYLSRTCRQYLTKVATEFPGMDWFKDCSIVASNDINEDTLYSLKNQGHEINAFGVGTHLVTCQSQPALGCVFKLVQLNDEPRMKLSQDVEKVTIPGRKETYRLYSKDGSPLVDLMQNGSEPPPRAGTRVLCRHPFMEAKRAYVVPARVEKLHKLRFDQGKLTAPLETLEELKTRTKSQLTTLRQDHMRALNPTPYKVSVSDALYQHVHELWLDNAPVGELY